MSFLVTLIVSSLLSHAHDHDHDHSQPLHTILVTPENFFDSHRHDTTDRVEVLNKAHIDQSNATTLNEAVDRMQGVDSQDYCANCGAKRISINGLRGDHTSVLIDGIPLYSAVTSVYGFDAIPMQSVGEIEVMRGTGSALLNPEAIGGTINIITLSPTESGAKATASYGTYNSRIFELLNNYVSESKKYKLSVGGELSRQNPWDVDGNGMSESPWRSRYSVFLKQSVNLSDTLQWATRLSFADLEIIGGNMARFRLKSPISLQASENDFVDGDVRKPYIGEISKISERVQVQRTELTSKMIKILNSTSTLEWNLGGATYNQDSIYLHAFDYKTKDLTLYTDLRWRTQLTTNQTLLLGTSARQETLRSQSVVMYDTNNIPKDDFDYTAFSIFAQHEWSLPYNWELSSAIRLEKMKSEWKFLNTLERSVLSPRLFAKWQPTDHFMQQLAYGYGYRMPLTSIESAHGAYDGFLVNITELEKSHSFLYSVSYNTESYYLTPSVHFTRLKNMSYPLQPAVAHSGPLQFVNDPQSHNLVIYDILGGVKPFPNWLLEAGFEYYTYPDDYKSKLPTAAIERRVNLRSELEWNNYTFVVSGMWVGARDLSKYYMYPDHYNISQGLLGVADQKFQRSPYYWLWNTSLSKKVRSFEVTAGVENIFNYTQTKKGDSPAMWHSHDGHTHLDNRHVWGPNRGREFYLRLSYNF